MELSESITTGPAEQAGSRRNAELPLPEILGAPLAGGSWGGAGNHLGSLGAAYTHGKSCQQLMKEVGGGEISRGEECGGSGAHVAPPSCLLQGSHSWDGHGLGPVGDTRAVRRDPKNGLGCTSAVTQR